MSHKLIKNNISYDKNTIIIKNWNDLVGMENENYIIDVDVESCNACIHGKDGEFFQYLSTHTFYGSKYIQSTEILQSCGFNVILESWD